MKYIDFVQAHNNKPVFMEGKLDGDLILGHQTWTLLIRIRVHAQGPKLKII